MVQLEELGLLKMDFLGLRTLTVLKDSVKNIKASRGIDVDIDHIDFNDKGTLGLYRNRKDGRGIPARVCRYAKLHEGTQSTEL